MIPDRILSKIDKQPGGCWVWTGSRTWRNKNSTWHYGVVSYEGRQWRVHRLIYTLTVGPIPEGLVLDHLCENTLCCNPAHVQAVRQSVNVARGNAPTAINGRKTHCKHGHKFNEANTRHTNKGRACRKCDLIRQTAKYRMKYGYPPEGKQRRVSPIWGQHFRDKTHCPHGHEYSPENTRVYKGGRFCLACERRRMEERRDRGEFRKKKATN